jgi:hypothetical protein
MPSGALTLDELPDSDNRFLPEYQLTQEWFEQTIEYLKEKEAAKARRHEAEIESEIGAEMDVDVDVETEPPVSSHQKERRLGNRWISTEPFPLGEFAYLL